jgi:hypothetical protein
VFDHILKFMTLGTVIVGSIAVYAALHTNNRRLGADIFLRYSDRISDLRRSLPMAAFFERDAPGNTEITPEERRAAHEIIYSIFELHELKVHGFLPSAIWKIREPDMKGFFLCHSFGRNWRLCNTDLQDIHASRRGSDKSGEARHDKP